MTDRYVVFSHGKESGPWGSKIAAMAEIAREEGFTVESVAVSYTHLTLPTTPY